MFVLSIHLKQLVSIDIVLANSKAPCDLTSVSLLSRFFFCLVILFYLHIKAIATRNHSYSVEQDRSLRRAELKIRRDRRHVLFYSFPSLSIHSTLIFEVHLASELQVKCMYLILLGKNNGLFSLFLIRIH